MKYIIIGIFIGWFGILKSQTVSVVDDDTDMALEGAEFISENTQQSCITNKDGKADISFLQESDTIQIRHLGYETKRVSLHSLMKNLMVRLEPTDFKIDQVVVVGTRWQQNAPKVPSKIATITSRDIALQNPQTAADLLGTSGKIFIQKSQQGGGSPMIRGFATNRLIYTVDGIRMNTAIFRSGNIQNVINLDPFAVEKTEVLFGAGSVMYGSDAIGGVMAFKTLSPSLSSTNKPVTNGKANLRYSSANQEVTGHFDINIGLKKWAFMNSFSSWNFDHLRQGSHGPIDYIKSFYPQRHNNQDVEITQSDPLLQIPSAYSQINLLQKVLFRPNELWDLQYSFHFSETSSYGRYDRHLRLRNGSPRYAEWDYGPQKWLMHNLQITHSKSNIIFDLASLKLALQSFEESRIERPFNSLDRSIQTEKVWAYSSNLDFIKKITSKYILFYGTEFVCDDVSSSGITSNISTKSSERAASRYPLSTWSSMAVYAKSEFSLSDNWTIQSGVRYNKVKLNANFNNNKDFFPFPFSYAHIDNHSISANLGIVFRHSNNWIMRGNISRAFRSPNVDDLGKIFDSQPGAITVPNPDLKAEYAYNFDLGVTKVFSQILKIEMSGYHTLLKNALVRRDYTLNGLDSVLYFGELSKVQAMQNAAEAVVYGVEFGLEVKIGRRFSFLSDVNFQKGEEELDDTSSSPSRHAAPTFGVSKLRYHTGDLTVELYGVYQAAKKASDLPQEEQAKDEIYAKDNNGNNYSPSWYTLNFKFLTKISESISISGGLENVTDQRYRPYSSGISGAGRNAFFALNFKF
ncbi:MAG: TonB-dependent receptor [Saprospiraceae bacterium]